jgi:hypothetical protein
MSETLILVAATIARMEWINWDDGGESREHWLWRQGLGPQPAMGGWPAIPTGTQPDR